MPQEPLDRLTVRELAWELLVDERSIRKELRDPGSVRGLVGARIRRVLAQRGLLASEEQKKPRKTLPRMAAGE